jgi:hypothetical protein
MVWMGTVRPSDSDRSGRRRSRRAWHQAPSAELGLPLRRHATRAVEAPERINGREPVVRAGDRRLLSPAPHLPATRATSPERFGTEVLLGVAVLQPKPAYGNTRPVVDPDKSSLWRARCKMGVLQQVPGRWGGRGCGKEPPPAGGNVRPLRGRPTPALPARRAPRSRARPARRGRTPGRLACPVRVKRPAAFRGPVHGGPSLRASVRLSGSIHPAAHGEITDGSRAGHR